MPLYLALLFVLICMKIISLLLKMMDAIELEKSKINTWFYTEGRSIEVEKIDLKNSTMVAQKLNLTFKDLWSFMATVSPFSGSNIIICSMLNFEFFKLPAKGEEYFLSIDIKLALINTLDCDLRDTNLINLDTTICLT